MKIAKSLVMALMSLLIFSLIGLLSGCANTDLKVVEVPVPCKAQMPTRQTSDNLLQNIKNILIYAEQLENALLLCKGE